MEQLAEAGAVVTGAASGIGLAIADHLAAAGAHVLLTDLDEEALAPAVDRVARHGTEVEGLVADVRHPEALERAADHAVDRFGGLHVAVNNAGIVNGGLTWKLPLEEWHRVLDVDLWGVIHGVRAFVPRILATGQPGHVVNVASMAAVIAHASLGPYTVAKHGVLGLSDVLRADLQAADAPVGVSVVLPGAIRTGMNPVGAIEPDAVAANVIDAITHQRAYVFTDHHSTRSVDARLQAILAARRDVLEQPDSS